ncbi:MAG: hypothetical protein M1838_005486 [Thelocarpon superellum]|nr:MAG: hypothetical protein M1838_005486 [Thelocarpon superellum]
MAHRPMLRHRAALPAAIALVSGSMVFFPARVVHAEAPELAVSSRKPIYDRSRASAEPASDPATSNARLSPSTRASTEPQPTTLTPTDRLALEIRRARLFVFAHVAAGEDRVNDFMTSFLHLESSFTGTIASLAPPRESGERVLPGVVYVLVAAMAGSIISRNRNILLRASVPVALGLGAGWVVMPRTMRNVGELIWKFEERVPVISNNHMRIQGAVEETWRLARLQSEGALAIVDQKVQGGRAAVESWVKKGR